MALGNTSIFGKKRPILCVTEKNTKKAIPELVRGAPNWFPSKFPIWGSPNQFGVHSNLGTNTYTRCAWAGGTTKNYCVSHLRAIFTRINIYKFIRKYLSHNSC